MLPSALRVMEIWSVTVWPDVLVRVPLIVTVSPCDWVVRVKVPLPSGPPVNVPVCTLV